MKRALVLAVMVLTVSYSTAAPGQLPSTGETNDLKAWGANVRITCALTKSQTFRDLLLSATPGSFKANASAWQGNFKAAAATLPNASKVEAALKALDSALAGDAEFGKWTAYQVMTASWEGLPGNAAAKSALRAALNTLQDAGMMCLTFLGRKETEPASSELVGTADMLLNKSGFERLLALTNTALYTTSSESYSSEEINLLSYAMDGVKLIRSSVPEGVASLTAYCCCNRTTRVCVSGSGSCGLVAGKCATGSSWCP